MATFQIMQLIFDLLGQPPLRVASPHLPTHVITTRATFSARAA